MKRNNPLICISKIKFPISIIAGVAAGCVQVRLFLQRPVWLAAGECFKIKSISYKCELNVVEI
jgi:hypothetical protein